MSLPPLPNPEGGYGYDWMDNLTGGWHAVGLWGCDGWNLGSWPLVIVVHYEGDGLYGVATYVEGDIEVKEFTSFDERNKATDKIALFYWNHYEVETAPKTADDARLGPYIGL